jgi:hypothetical protein
VALHASNPELVFNGKPESRIIAESRDLTWENLRALTTPFENNGGRKILVVGDSQGGDFVNLMLAHDPGLRNRLRTFASTKGCQIKLTSAFFDDPVARAHPDFKVAGSCKTDVQRFRRDPRLTEADDIVLVYAWMAPAARYLPDEVAAIAKINPRARIFVVGKKDMAKSSLSFFSTLKDIEMVNEAAAASIPDDVLSFNAAVSAQFGDHYLDQLSLVCPDRCNLFTPDGTPIYFDERHLTKDALEALGPGTAVKRMLAPLL